MSAHTPGPWIAKQRASGRWFVGAEAQLGGRGAAAKITAMWDVANGLPQHDNTAEGNARLIAAAPELLAACRVIVEAHSALFVGLPLCIDGAPIDHTLLNRASELAQAAIAKADGHLDTHPSSRIQRAR